MPIQGLLRSSITVGTTALNVANHFGGVPFAGAAATLLGEIGQSCDQVKIHRSKCHLLMRRAQTILDGLQDGLTGLEGTALQQAADELELTLGQINRKMNQWSNYNLIRAFWKRDEIGMSIEDADQSLNAYLAKFLIKAQCSTHERLHEAEEIRRRDQDETQAVLHELLTSNGHLRRLVEMHMAGEPVAEDVMGAAQTELHAQPRDTARYHEYERNVYNLYRSTGVMPTIPDLSHEVVRMRGDPVTGGMYSDVWQGTWLGNVKVALKSLRQVKISLRAQERFEHEIAVWHTLKHPHVLPFLGVVSNIGPNIHVVSPWQSNGNAREYVKDPTVNRLKLLVGAASGVEYLHGRDKPVVHGNLRCANILVSDKGEAMISDFNLSRVIEDITETPASVTLTASGNSRWCAPELMSSGTSSLTTATDVYSFSMAILECLTSENPFAHLKRDPRVVLAVVRGERPLRPAGNRWFSSGLWELMESCWNEDPACRPGMADVTASLRILSQEVSDA